MRETLIPVVAALLVAAAMVYQAKTPEPTLCAPPPVALGELPGYASEELPESEAERAVLPADTRVLRRRYYDASGDWFVVSAVIGGKSKSSIHRPELCLPSQGMLMSNPRTVDAGGFGWHFTDLDSHGIQTLFAYTFFNQEGFRTSSHLARIFRDVWDRSVLNRVDRWVMVTVRFSRPDEEALRAFLDKLQLGEVEQ